MLADDRDLEAVRCTSRSSRPASSSAAGLQAARGDDLVEQEAACERRRPRGVERRCRRSARCSAGGRRAASAGLAELLTRSTVDEVDDAATAGIGIARLAVDPTHAARRRRTSRGGGEPGRGIARSIMMPAAGRGRAPPSHAATLTDIAAVARMSAIGTALRRRASSSRREHAAGRASCCSTGHAILRAAVWATLPDIAAATRAASTEPHRRTLRCRYRELLRRERFVRISCRSIAPTALHISVIT